MRKKTFNLLFAALFFMAFFAFNGVLSGDNFNTRQTFFTVKQASKSGKGKIIGTILNRKGEPVENVAIFVEEMETHEDQESSMLSIDPVKTNANGKFKIRRVPSGTYKVTAVPQEEDNLLNSDTFNVNVFARKTAVVDMELSAKASDGAEYVGRAVCEKCHSDKVSAWSKSAHSKTHQTPSESSVAAPFDNTVRFTDDKKVKFNAFISGDDFKVILFDLNDESVSVTYNVVRTHGGVAHAGKQRFHVKIGNSHFILPVQFNNRNIDTDNPDAAWVSYNPERWYNDDGTLRTPDPAKHSYEQNCEGCHATGLSVEKVGSEFVSSSLEMGIGCEECHGPGSIHSDTGGGNGNNIINPDFITIEGARQVCGQCHTRVVSKPGDNGANFETGYPAIVDGNEIIPYESGKELNEFISFTKLDGKPTPGLWNDDDKDTFGEDASENNHSKQHQQQAFDFSKSHHFTEVGLMCFNCHFAHGGDIEAQLRFENDDNSLCLKCHPDKQEMGEDVVNGKVLNVHTKHPWDPSGSKASRCSGCHMPKTAKSAVFTDIHSHIFDIIEPPISLAMAEKNEANGIKNDASTVIMNSCFSCHPDEDYGVARYMAWEAKVVE